MKLISGRVISSRVVSLSDAATIISSFAASETGASDAISVYVRRAADAFNQLAMFHNLYSSGPVGKDHPRDENQLKSLRSVAEEVVKSEECPEMNHHKRKKKRPGNRDSDIKSNDLVKTDLDSAAAAATIEDVRDKMSHSAEKVKAEEKIKEVEDVKTESNSVEGDSRKKGKKRKKVEGETLVVETKKRKKLMEV
ncbi:unnamed protein product [Cuscuta epithymum]|uniref:Uncharacterized protein n=1 Tax=Cuscuta epithymum TaxID=186058 RepID=A0AAV0F6F6_9ASTE|nr:unnamed protein product [Cuscuta epithymum]CAH9131020.1 unnamed protein product [Cuscuta epithymum]